MRVATVPEVVGNVKLGFPVAVQSGAGAAANFADEAYREPPAPRSWPAPPTLGQSDIVFKVRRRAEDEVGLLRQGGMLIGFIWPAQNPELMQQLAAGPPCSPSMRCRASSRARRRWTR